MKQIGSFILLMILMVSPLQAEEIPPDTIFVFLTEMSELTTYHQYHDSVRWRLGRNGIELENGEIDTTKADSTLVRKIWLDYGEWIQKWSIEYGIPAELILTFICIESRGDPKAVNRVNVGLMQTSVPTARAALKNKRITREWLFEPENSIQAGTAYIALQADITYYDPPKVAAAYNRGDLLKTRRNRWKMQQSWKYVDHYVEWFNVIWGMFNELETIPPISFTRYFRETKPE